ncbi:MAG: hypothetical protein GX911_07625 [Spirochaetales bacterium]|nr:hypothetical protein [Spirochaetales bacterium]
MFLSRITNKKTGRVFLQIVESYRKDGRSHQRTVKALGYLDELQKEYEDPIAHFKEVARRMTEEAKAAKAHRILTVSSEQRLVIGEKKTRNIGHLALSALFHQLQIDAFIDDRRRHLDVEDDLNHIFRTLVFERALDPASTPGAWNAGGKFPDKSEYSLEQVYRSLGIFLSWRDDLIRHLDSQMRKRYGRGNLLISHDLSGSGTGEPGIRLRLLLDEEGLPVTYELADGRRMIDGPALPIHVADRQDGHAVRHATKRLKEWFLDIHQVLLRIEEPSGTVDERIRFHALAGFVALLLIRLLEKRLDWRYSAETIRTTLSKANGTQVGDFYIFDHFDEPLRDIGQDLGIDFSRQNLTTAELHSLMASVKRSP